MIIGLLIGGVLRGQELIRNAQNTSMIQQVKAYQGAMVTFSDAYHSMPGDMALASARVPGCQTGNTNNCLNGNGNGIIGNVETNLPWLDITNDITSENTQFWKHLASAHLISGVDPSSATPAFGKTHPNSKVAGGFFIRYAVFQSASAASQTTHFLVTRRNISGAWDCGSIGAVRYTGSCTTSPQRASQIDRKMDDGIALAGDAIAISAGWDTGCGRSNEGINGKNGYAEGTTTDACDMMFVVK